jgi:hypothetical protein
LSVWVVFPSAAPLPQAKLCVQAWKQAGYHVAIACEDDRGRKLPVDFHIEQPEYPGYASSVNRLIHHILANDVDCEMVVLAGDDMFPDQHRRAVDIQIALLERFESTLFVLQPTGDRWALPGGATPQSERVAGSPWLGREWCRRAYGGQGPLWQEYVHCFADQELAEVATLHGVMWWEPSICHRHEHFLRRGSMPPPHAAKAYAAYHADEATFRRRQAQGFPGSELLP